VPSGSEGTPARTHRRYTVDDVVKLKLIATLLSYGWTTQRIRTSLAQIDKVQSSPNLDAAALLIHEPNLLLILFKSKSGERIIVDALSRGGQTVLPMVLETLASETRAKLAEYKGDG